MIANHSPTVSHDEPSRRINASVGIATRIRVIVTKLAGVATALCPKRLRTSCAGRRGHDHRLRTRGRRRLEVGTGDTAHGRGHDRAGPGEQRVVVGADEPHDAVDLGRLAVRAADEHAVVVGAVDEHLDRLARPARGATRS